MIKFPLVALATAFGLVSVAHAETATYVIDPSHTFASFEIGHFGTSTNRGRFNTTSGTVVLDKVAKTGKLDITVDTTSLDTGTVAFTKHISGPEMLNVAAFPTAHFVGTKFVFNGDKVVEVSGDLTLLGKTNPAVFKAQNYNCYQSPFTKHEVCGGDFDATIVRSQYGISYGLAYGMPDIVHLVIQVEAGKQ